MMISTSDIPAIVSQYIDSQVAPKASGMQKFGVYSILFVMNSKMPEIVARYTPVMRMAGIMDDNGMIDLDFTYNLTKDAMGHAEKVNLFGYVLDSTDVESLYAIAQRHGR